MSTANSKKHLIDTLCTEMQRAGTLTVLHTHMVASKIGLSATEFEALDVIRRNQPMTAGKLACFSGLTTGAITGLIDRLERGKFVKRVNDPTDRRRVLLEPCYDSATHKKVIKMYEPVGRLFYQCTDKYTIEQIAFLIQAQTELNDIVEQLLKQRQSE